LFLIQQAFNDGNLEEFDPLFFEDNSLFCCGCPFNISLGLAVEAQ
jgi:hypothetical protein